MLRRDHKSDKNCFWLKTVNSWASFVIYTYIESPCLTIQLIYYKFKISFIINEISLIFWGVKILIHTKKVE